VPFFERDDTRIHYEIHGDGPPVLALAPGGMQSSIPIWSGVSYNAIERLAPNYQVIAMDQRNAGQSTAPITGEDGWRDYTADQVALLDHLGVERFHAAGMCIGGSFIMGLAEAVPERLASAVMLQTIGYDDNRETFFELFNSWANGVRSAHPSVTEDDWAKFRTTMFGGGFLFNVGEDVVANCHIPLLILMGEDVYHPETTSRRVAELALNATLIERWKEGPYAVAAGAAIDEFLATHS
jgi:pimeloyl-ACP methyl ester carboxylesterase